MSKLTKALIPGYGANPTKPNSNPLSGLAPDLETGLPKGLPSGVGKAALKFSNPVGGIGPDINGDIGYQKGWMDTSSNGTPDAAPKGPQHSIWGDPDLSKRGWGWGMDSTGKLQTGVMGGGPAGSAFGPQGAAIGTGAPSTGVMGATGGAGATGGMGAPPTGVMGASPGGGLMGQIPPVGAKGSGARGLVDKGQQLAAQMRQGQQTGQLSGQPAGMPPQHGYMPAQQGAAMGPGGPQGQAGMGGQPGTPGGAFTAPQQFPPVPGTPAYGQNQQGTGIQALIDQLRQQQPQQSQ